MEKGIENMNEGKSRKALKKEIKRLLPEQPLSEKKVTVKGKKQYLKNFPNL